MMDLDKYRLTGQQFSLTDFPTRADHGMDKDELRRKHSELAKEIDNLQEALFAESKQSVLFVLQAMDAAGKDSSIAKLTKSLNTQGSRVCSFKKPTKQELAHDFLWRIHAQAPAAGEITFFNRSHYEDVLIVKVHGWASEHEIQNRYEHINAFEALLAERGTRVIKCMLNISPEYQLSRFRSRLENPEKHWKFNPGDLDERQHWHDYMSAFEIAMQQCASEASPWYVVPAENRRFRDLMLMSLLHSTLSQMQSKYPKPEFDLGQFNVDTLDDLAKINDQ